MSTIRVERVNFCDLRDTEAPCSRDDLEAFGVGAPDDRLDEVVGADGLGKLLQPEFIEGATGIGGWFVDGVDGKVLEFAAVLYD